MTLIEVSIGPVVIENLLLGMMGTIAAVVGVIAATKTDRITADRGILPALTERSMTVSAQGRMSEPLILRFTVTDTAVTLLRIEVANQLDKGARTAQCVEAAQRIFLAEVEPKVVQRWYNANPYCDGETKQLPIQVFLRTNGQAACRTIWVAMSSRMMPGPALNDVSDFAWFLEGPCPRVNPAPVQMPSRTGTDRL
jgi:hypothetical protein